MAGLATIIGTAGVLWIAAADTSAQRPTQDDPGDSSSVTAHTLDTRTELDLLGTSAAILIVGTGGDRVLLTLTDGWIWDDYDFTFGTSVDPAVEPPLWVRMRFDGSRTLTVIAEAGVEVGRPRVEDMTVVLVIDGETFTNGAGFCELVVHEAEFDRGATIRQGSYRAVSAFGELSCTGVEEIRTGERLSFSAAFTLNDS
jgi:hypothetical protein